jgi:hypothetical protein
MIFHIVAPPERRICCRCWTRIFDVEHKSDHLQRVYNPWTIYQSDQQTCLDIRSRIVTGEKGLLSKTDEVPNCSSGRGQNLRGSDILCALVWTTHTIQLYKNSRTRLSNTL